MPEEKSNEIRPISEITYVGPALESALKKLGIKTIEELYNFLPRDCLDLTATAISKLPKAREKVAIYGKIEDCTTIKTPRRRLWLTRAKLNDGSGELPVVWFNQPYLRNFFNSEAKYVFYGQILENKNGRGVYLNAPLIYPNIQIVVRYSLTRGITSRQISRVIKSALEKFELTEFLPSDILRKFSLPEINEAIKLVHFPENINEFKRGRQRIVFNTLLNFILANLYQQKNLRLTNFYKIIPDKKYLNDFISSLQFKLTDDQQKALAEIIADFSAGSAMNRLLQGDVGSGKTIVALAAALQVVRSGYQVAWLAPTEILALQHFETISKFVSTFNIKVDLLTAGTIKNLKSQISNLKFRPKDSKIIEADITIGTHAILQKGVKFKDLALVIVDEQHRFGVDQRGKLMQNSKVTPLRQGYEGQETQNDSLKLKNSKLIRNSKFEIENSSQRVPHFLSLSATPIPRTLAHVVFGNLDISVIKTKPTGRKQVKTFFLPEEKRKDSYKFIDSLIAKGQQAFVICPLIESKGEEIYEDEVEVKSVEDEIKNLKKTALKNRRIASIHGKMKSSQKQEIMEKMRAGEIDVLVSTSVIEVGVDIPLATVMVIENAEQFGLSQLHQFRGRVGRNDLESYCFIFSQNESEKTRDRLKAFVQLADGFKLAQMDLKLRGPGAILGLEQSGFRGINPLWFENSKLLADIAVEAKHMVNRLDDLPILKKKVLDLLDTEHME